MRQRAIILVVAVFLGLTSAFLVRNYANEAKEVALERTTSIEVLVAAGDLPIGATLARLQALKLVETKLGLAPIDQEEIRIIDMLINQLISVNNLTTK